MQQLRNRYSSLLLLVALLMVSMGAWAQTGLRGHVADQSGEPLIGVSVQVKGATGQGAITDLDGNFVVNVKAGTPLVFSYIGYNSVTKPASNGMSVVLTENSKVLDDVVVVGYGVQKKSSVTGAISQVKPEDMENRTITNAQQALEGKTAGVQIVNTSSAPGSSPTVRIRGYSSNVSSEPLYVVDGVRLKDISGIDPNDIQSMEILKDAASAAIYGAEAGNGVVLITTKKGKAGEGHITYNFQYAGEHVGRVPKMLNSEEYIKYMAEAHAFTEDYLLKTWDGVTNTDWTDVAFETGQLMKHNVAFDGGNDRGNYYLSLTYLDNDGIVTGKSDTYKRLTATVNAEYQIKNWLKVGTTNQIEKYNVRQVSSNNEYGSMLTSVLAMDPLTRDVYSYDELPYHMLNALSSGKHLLQDGEGRYYGVSQYYSGEQYNPLVMRDNSLSQNSGYNVNGSIFANITPLKGLTFTSRFGYRLSGTRSSTTTLPFYGNATQSRDYVGQSNTSSTTIYYQWENFANYMQKFGDHTVTAMAGMSYQEQSYDYVTGGLQPNGEDALLKNDPLFYYLNFGAASAIKSVAGEKTRTSKLSYFGRVGYDYAGKYIAQFSLRADAADLALLPKNKRWGYFPAASLGWTISEEKFFEPLKSTINSLKLRASWGQNGSLSALGSYSYSTDMAQSGLYPFIPGNTYVRGVSPSTMGNDDLKWETSEQTNVGFDAYLLNMRLNFNMDYYVKKTKDLLVWNTTPSLEIGGSTSPINAGKVRNRGFEFELGWHDHIKDFNYSIKGNLATLSNEVTYLDPSVTRLAGSTFHTYTITYFEQGYPVYYFRGYKFKGIDSATGNPTFEDLDNSGTVSDGDLTKIGDAIPDFTYGITLTAAWKGFDLMVFGAGSHGNDVFNCINRPDYVTTNKLKDFFYKDRWTADNPNGTQPRAGATDMDKYACSSAMVFDGSYFKIKQIQLGYSLPKTLLRHAGLSNVRLYCSLDDFFTFTSYKGFDPEVASNATSGMGIDKGSYPTSKKVVFGINITM